MIDAALPSTARLVRRRGAMEEERGGYKSGNVDGRGVESKESHIFSEERSAFPDGGETPPSPS